MSRTTTKPTDVERDARRRADRERIERAAKELQSSDGWQRWVEVRRNNGLGRYSVTNQMLLALEAWSRGISPSYVAGYRWWAEHGYQVRKGEKGLKVQAPVRRRTEDGGGEEGHAVVGFRAVSVFDRAQVEAGPDAIELAPPSEPVTGESHEAHIEPLVEFLIGRGVKVWFGEIERSGARGYFRSDTNEIAIEFTQSPNAKLRTLLHEAAHALVEERRKADKEEGTVLLSYAEEEVVVEVTGHVATASLGLDTAGEAIPYVAGWGDNGGLEAARRGAELIDEVARQLEQAAQVDREAGAF